MKYLLATLLLLCIEAHAQTASILSRYDDGTLRVVFLSTRGPCEEGARRAFVRVNDKAFKGCWFIVGRALYIDPDGDADVMRFKATRFGLVGA